jgi:hypothetical protein
MPAFAGPNDSRNDNRAVRGRVAVETLTRCSNRRPSDPKTEAGGWLITTTWRLSEGNRASAPVFGEHVVGRCRKKRR